MQKPYNYSLLLIGQLHYTPPEKCQGFFDNLYIFSLTVIFIHAQSCFLHTKKQETRPNQRISCEGNRRDSYSLVITKVTSPPSTGAMISCVVSNS